MKKMALHILKEPIIRLTNQLGSLTFSGVAFFWLPHYKL